MIRFNELANAAAGYLRRLQHAFGDFQPTLLRLPRDGRRLSDQHDQFRHLAALWMVGSIALVVVTWVCFWLGLDLTTTAFAFLIVIVFLSLMDSFASSAFFSVVAIGCLNFFFVEPLFTFQIEYAQDISALAAFLITSLAVTGLVRRARRLGELQEEQARLLDLITDAVFVRDANDMITFWNRGAEQLYGWKREEVMGKVTHQVLQTVFPATLAEITETLSRTGRWEGELLHLTRDGAQVSVASRWSLPRDQRGLPIGTLESNTDITERKKAEDALRRSQAAYLAEAQKLSHTGSFGWNVSSGEISWSEQTFRIFGYEPTPSVAIKMVLDRVHPDDLGLVQQAIDRAATHKEAFDFEHRLQMPDGSVKYLHVVAHALIDEPQTLQFAGAVMDVTARKEAERALRHSEKRYQNLFQAMAVSLWEFDYSRANDMMRSLHKSGVADFGKYFRENPEAMRELMRATRVVDVNDQTVELFGRGSKEELLTNLEPFWPQESWEDYIATVVSSIGNNKFSTETRFRRLDGTIFNGHMTTWYASENKASGLTGIIDITARKQAVAKLEASEQRYRHLFHHMPVALWQLNARGVLELFKQLRSEGVTDLDAYFDAHPGLVQRCMEMLIIEEVNQHTVQMLGGRDPSEFIGTSIARYFPENSPTFRRSMVSRYRGNPNYAAETKLFTLDGRVVDVLYTASRVGPISEPGMSLLGVVDITERKQAEEALRRSEQRYRHLFNHTPIALWQLNAQPYVAMFQQLRADGVEDLAAYIDEHPEFLSKALSGLIVEEVNDHAIQLFGAHDRKDLTDHPTHWMWREGTDTLRRSMESRWRGEESFQEVTKLATRDGRAIDVLYTVARPPMVEGLPISLVSMIDFTERVRAQEELQRLRADFAHASRVSMLGELTASIAHEVNQPLAAITAGGEASLRWLARPTPDVGEVRELTTRIVADARRASDIIVRIRAMATRRVPEQTLISLDDVIREALQFLHHEVQSRGVVVSHFPALNSQKVFADRTQLQQVVVNLAVNAVQAVAQAGSRNRNIIIRTVAHDLATLSCSVEDSGPGIEPQHITRLFDSFFTTKDGGMGMGLRICRSVIEAHGGRINADNGSSQGGARFFFTLPVAAPTT